MQRIKNNDKSHTGRAGINNLWRYLGNGWLKKILEQAKVNEEGKIDIDAVMKLVNAEFPKHAVPKEDYNSKATELKTANDTIRDLKKQNEGNEDLQSKIRNTRQRSET